jgi:hypothetical protein
MEASLKDFSNQLDNLLADEAGGAGRCLWGPSCPFGRQGEPVRRTPFWAKLVLTQ